MDRTIVIGVPAPIPHGHRVEVVDRTDESGERTVLAVIDLETGIRYQPGPATSTRTTAWVGRVLECTVMQTRGSISTTFLIDPVSPGAAEADIALRGADAAASAVTNEALRWGGAGRPPAPEPERFW